MHKVSYRQVPSPIQWCRLTWYSSCLGYWVPGLAAKAICERFCYDIRYVLTPIFGDSFVDSCVKPGDSQFKKWQIEPRIVDQLTFELHVFNETNNAPRAARKASMVPPTGFKISSNADTAEQLGSAKKQLHREKDTKAKRDQASRASEADRKLQNDPPSNPMQNDAPDTPRAKFVRPRKRVRTPSSSTIGGLQTPQSGVVSASNPRKRQKHQEPDAANSSPIRIRFPLSQNNKKQGKAATLESIPDTTSTAAPSSAHSLAVHDRFPDTDDDELTSEDEYLRRSSEGIPKRDESPAKHDEAEQQPMSILKLPHGQPKANRYTDRHVHFVTALFSETPRSHIFLHDHGHQMEQKRCTEYNKFLAGNNIGSAVARDRNTDQMELSGMDYACPADSPSLTYQDLVLSFPSPPFTSLGRYAQWRIAELQAFKEEVRQAYAAKVKESMEIRLRQGYKCLAIQDLCFPHVDRELRRLHGEPEDMHDIPREKTYRYHDLKKMLEMREGTLNMDDSLNDTVVVAHEQVHPPLSDRPPAGFPETVSAPERRQTQAYRDWKRGQQEEEERLIAVQKRDKIRAKRAAAEVERIANLPTVVGLVPDMSRVERVAAIALLKMNSSKNNSSRYLTEAQQSVLGIGGHGGPLQMAHGHRVVPPPLGPQHPGCMQESEDACQPNLSAESLPMQRIAGLDASIQDQLPVGHSATSGMVSSPPRSTIGQSLLQTSIVQAPEQQIFDVEISSFPAPAVEALQAQTSALEIPSHQAPVITSSSPRAPDIGIEPRQIPVRIDSSQASVIEPSSPLDSVPELSMSPEPRPWSFQPSIAFPSIPHLSSSNVAPLSDVETAISQSTLPPFAGVFGNRAINTQSASIQASNVQTHNISNPSYPSAPQSDNVATLTTPASELASNVLARPMIPALPRGQVLPSSSLSAYSTDHNRLLPLPILPGALAQNNLLGRPPAGTKGCAMPSSLPALGALKRLAQARKQASSRSAPPLHPVLSQPLRSLRPATAHGSNYCKPAPGQPWTDWRAAANQFGIDNRPTLEPPASDANTMRLRQAPDSSLHSKNTRDESQSTLMSFDHNAVDSSSTSYATTNVTSGERKVYTSQFSVSSHYATTSQSFGGEGPFLSTTRFGPITQNETGRHSGPTYVSQQVTAAAASRAASAPINLLTSPGSPYSSSNSDHRILFQRMFQNEAHAPPIRGRAEDQLREIRRSRNQTQGNNPSRLPSHNQSEQ